METMANEMGFWRNEANDVPLSVVSHIRRAALVYAEREALVHKGERLSWAALYTRAVRLKNALHGAGIGAGDVVSVISPNVPLAVETHFGVPGARAVLNAINTRLDVDTVAYILSHGESKLLLVDTQFIELAEAACAMMEGPAPQIIEAPDRASGFTPTGRHPLYEAFLAAASAEGDLELPRDEWDSLALNYTSGTTGRPKGVVYHHRGAYLLSLGFPVTWNMRLFPRIMTIVPLFHCNGWHHAWVAAVTGGAMVTCRDITAEAIFAAMRDEKVTHFGGAPIVMNMLINAPKEMQYRPEHEVQIMTAGAAPSPSTIKGIEELGLKITQVYGLTETHGAVVECLHQDEWSDLPAAERYAHMARVGINSPSMEEIDVWDTETQRPVPRDGATIGEVVLRGNVMMKGYYKNPEATNEAFKGGMFHTGDIAVRHPNGYVQITDRLKDVIISGGENISSLEVEAILMAHPDVSLCAVVARPDEKWGETPCAFIELKAGRSPGAEEIIAHCRTHLAGFKCPKTVIFEELPKTSTGKVQKFELRAKAKAL